MCKRVQHTGICASNVFVLEYFCNIVKGKLAKFNNANVPQHRKHIAIIFVINILLLFYLFFFIKNVQ